MRLTPLLSALVLVVAGLGVAVPGAGHTQEPTANNQYQITDQGILTGYGGPVVSPLGGHVENPATGENVFVPCGEQSVRTNGSGGQHQHVGSCVAYDIALQTDVNEIEANVEYENQVVTHPAYTANLDLYLYGPGGDILVSHEGPDSGTVGLVQSDLPEGSYTVLLVARYGAAPYDTTIRVTE